jgi:hypothetical protein
VILCAKCQSVCKKTLSRPTYEISKDIATIPVLIGHLLKGVFIFLARKAKTDGIPKAIHFANWLNNQTIFLIRKSNEIGKPRVIEVGQISKVYLLLLLEISRPKEYVWLYGLLNLQMIYPVSFIEKQK